MIKRTNSDGTVSVTFELTRQVGATAVNLCGDFNGWSRTDTAMSNGHEAFTVTLNLEPGRRYRFRYLLDGERWENDWAADAYIPNDFGGEDSVVDLVEVGERPPAAASMDEPAAKAPPAKKAAGAAKAAPAKKAAGAKKAAPDAAPAKKAAKKAEKAPKAAKPAKKAAKKADGAGELFEA